MILLTERVDRRPLSVWPGVGAVHEEPEDVVEVGVAYSLYSSEAKTIWNEMLDALAMKLNERAAASCVVCPDSSPF